uniref:Uncharacterized protein n=1 Tax=Salix viminalis TaxID=40686 RepID=A0A6N2MDN2_SALVM
MGLQDPDRGGTPNTHSEHLPSSSRSKVAPGFSLGEKEGVEDELHGRAEVCFLVSPSFLLIRSSIYPTKILEIKTQILFLAIVSASRSFSLNNQRDETE